MISNKHRYLGCSNKQKQQEIYDHLLYCVKTESPIQVLERFHYLFIKGTSYENFSIRNTLEAIVAAKDAEVEFPQFLNRCCHIIVNTWQMQPQSKIEIVELVDLLERALPPGSVVARSTRKLRQLVKNFLNTEYYIRLQRLARLIDGSIEPAQRRKNHRIEIVSNSVGDLIQRYPYLHKHCLLTEASTQDFQQTVKSIQAGIQSDYELNLSQYVTSRVRLAQIVKQYKAAKITRIPKRLIKQIANPTLLSDRELDRSLRHYTGKVERNSSYYDLSKNFLVHTSQVKTYKHF